MHTANHKRKYPRPAVSCRGSRWVAVDFRRNAARWGICGWPNSGGRCGATALAAPAGPWDGSSSSCGWVGCVRSCRLCVCAADRNVRGSSRFQQQYSYSSSDHECTSACSQTAKQWPQQMPAAAGHCNSSFSSAMVLRFVQTFSSSCQADNQLPMMLRSQNAYNVSP